MSEGVTKQTATVISQDQLADGIYSMWVQTRGIAVHARAGQFVNLYCQDQGKLLPRPISLCEIDQEHDRLRLVYRTAGGGTREFSRYTEGDRIEMMGPLGNGFTIDSRRNGILVAGGIGIPPMVQLARDCKKKGLGRVDIVVGYRDRQTFLADELQQYGTVHIATEDGSVGTRGNVLDAIEKDLVTTDGVLYGCGPTPMLRALKEYALVSHMDCFLSLEERMACGVGACLGCVCQTTEVDEHSQVHNRRVCKDGPVFDAREIELT